MRLIPGFSVLAASWPIAAAGAAQTQSLCQQLAGRIWQAASTGADVNPGQWIMNSAGLDPGAFDRRSKAASSTLRKALDPLADIVGPESFVQIAHLPGTSVYMGSMLGGTAHCQNSAFALVSTTGSAQVLTGPQGFTTPCWNITGAVGTVLGAPAYVESGTVDSSSADTLTRITPWKKNGWGRACQLTVQFKYRYRLAQQFCGDQLACGATAAVAVDVAQKYIVQRQLASPTMVSVGLDQPVPDFTYVNRGYADPGGHKALVNGWQLLARSSGSKTPGVPIMPSLLSSGFPTFGAQVPNGGWESSFSYVGFTLFPLTLDGRLYLGAVAHNGVGWREGSNILIAVYEPPTAEQTDLVPLAGFVVERSPAGLRGTLVAEGGSAIPVAIAEQ